MNNICIVPYEKWHQPYFEKFNRQWIEAWFKMEPLDEWVLTNPEEAILKDGGCILMALYDGEVAGTVGLRKLYEGVYEFTKMAVDEHFRRRGIAEALCYASFEKAAALGARKVVLYSNTKNAGAIKLYEKTGFRHLPVENDVYARANVKMEINLKEKAMKKIGLVGGISWVSTMDYYRFINEGVNEKMGGLNFAECVIYSLNFEEVQQRSWENSRDLLLNACENLKRSGVDAIMLCANTAHLFADEIQSEIELPFIHIVTATANAVKKMGLRKVGLIGTKFTMEMEFYRKKLEQSGLEVIVPGNQETRDFIQYTVKEELGRGLVKATTKQAYISIVNNLVDHGAEGIILGCTEIPMIISQQDFSIPVFNTTRIHSQAAVEFATAF